MRDVNNNTIEERIAPAAKILGAAAILFSAVHFWPWAESRIWQILNLSNLAMMLWCPVLVFVTARNREYVRSILPHTSVWAYLVVVFLSAAFAPSAARGLSFSIKLTLTFVAGFTLFSAAIRDGRNLRRAYDIVFAAAAISVAACLVARFGFWSEKFGFHGNAYKYGTYLGMVVPVGACYYFFSESRARKLLGCALVISGLLSAGTVGAAAAITAGIGAALFMGGKNNVRLAAGGSLVAGLILAVLVNAPLRNDMRLAESDSADLRQRYIEWQAEINLLEERAAVGSGAGSVNDYRSNFYYQLPKLNTLEAFDQNGWLATAAETGVLGLVCFCWIIVEYGRQALGQLRGNVVSQLAVSNFAGVAGACVANMFSSIHYNGIAITFVLLLALIWRAGAVCAEGEQ